MLVSLRIYAWQSEPSATTNLSEYSIVLDSRRAEILAELESFSSLQDYPEATVNEWICLTCERDRVFRELHRTAVRADVNRSLLQAFDALNSSLVLSASIGIENAPIDADLRRCLADCCLKLGKYVKNEHLRLLTDERTMPSGDDDEPEKIDYSIADDSSTDPFPQDKNFDWILPTSPFSADVDDANSQCDTQSNATFETCTDSLICPASTKYQKKKFALGRRFPFFPVDPLSACGVEFQSHYVERIQEILNTSVD